MTLHSYILYIPIMSTFTKSVLLNVPEPLLKLIDEAVEKRIAAKQPGDFTRVTRTSVILSLVYVALGTEPAKLLTTAKPRRTTKF